MKPIADSAAKQVPTLKHIIVLNQGLSPVEMKPHRDHWWHELVDRQSEEAYTEITSAEHVLMIIYTSGTTGSPKGAVHTHCGFPIKAAQDMAFGTDLHPGQRLYWITDMGWMMGPWLVFGSLLLGGTFLLYDGAPNYPHPDRLWELKFFASTGEPWNPGPWMWLFEKVGRMKRPIINYSGGTEISGGIVMGNPLLPLKPTAFSAPCPGIAADVFNEHGQSVRNQVGELVIKQPWIGMTRGFWRDPERYQETYWSRWPNTWVQGDFAVVDDDGQWYILGRSDDTIKVAGKRLGPAEVESILVAHPAVVEAAAIGVPDPVKGSAVIIFCVLSADVPPNDDLRQELINSIIASLGKPLAPRQVIFVNDLPKTRNAKVMRRMIRAAYLGHDPGDTSSLVNPDSVSEIEKAR
jgi:acetyl-CoA synthetase